MSSGTVGLRGLCDEGWFGSHRGNYLSTQQLFLKVQPNARTAEKVIESVLDYLEEERVKLGEPLALHSPPYRCLKACRDMEDFVCC